MDLVVLIVRQSLKLKNLQVDHASGFFQVGQNVPMYPHADAQVFFVDTLEQLMTQGVGDGFDLFDQWPGRRAKDDLFRPTIFYYRLTLHQTLGLQTVEQPRQGGTFDSHALGQLTLGRCFFKTCQMQQYQPTSLGQAKPGQTAIQFSTPASRHLCQLHAKTVLIG